MNPSLRSSHGNPSNPSTNDSLANEQTPLLEPRPENGVLSDPESGPTSKRPFSGDSKDVDEVVADDFNNSKNQPGIKPDVSIVGVISVLLLGIYNSPGRDVHALIQEFHPRLFYRKRRWLNRVSDVRYHLFGNW